MHAYFKTIPGALLTSFKYQPSTGIVKWSSVLIQNVSRHHELNSHKWFYDTKAICWHFQHTIPKRFHSSPISTMTPLFCRRVALIYTTFTMNPQFCKRFAWTYLHQLRWTTMMLWWRTSWALQGVWMNTYYTSKSPNNTFFGLVNMMISKRKFCNGLADGFHQGTPVVTHLWLTIGSK